MTNGCKKQIRGSKPCGRSLYDNEHCIFHSLDIEGKKEKFKDEFWKELERQEIEDLVFNFEGFVFPEDISFEKKVFRKDSIFKSVEFKKLVNFKEVEFREDANFAYAIFREGAYFTHTNFKSSCFSCEFKSEALFLEATFEKKANFKNAKFGKYVDFVSTKFLNEANFYNAIFADNVNFSLAEFSRVADFENVQFKGKALHGLFESLKNKGLLRFNGRFKIKNFLFTISTEIAKKNPVIERKIKDAWYLKDYETNYPAIYWIWNLTAKCGQSIFRWSLWSLGIAVLFALIFWQVTPFFEFTNPSFSKMPVTDFWSFLYFSFVTFTTLGFGDIVAIHWISKLFVTLEVIIGYVMLGGLISILANKLARRS